jgi:hypothetical protein
MKVLVLTSEPISAKHLRDALGDVNPHDAEVLVVAPALQENPFKFWFSDVDEAIARAEGVRAETVARLGPEVASTSGDTGDSDPVTAIEDALQTFSAERILVFTRGDGERYREDVDEREITERFGVPVARARI